MTIQLMVYLFGTLSSRVPDYDHAKGIQMDAPDHATPEDLLETLKIPLTHIGFISDGSCAIPLDARLTDKMSISFYSLISGG